MTLRTTLETSTEVTLAAAGSSSLAFPTGATDGADISKNRYTLATPPAGGWQDSGAGGHFEAAIFIDTTAATTLSAAMALYGYRASRAKWYYLGTLNNGTAISTLGSATGWSGIVTYQGMFDRIAIGPVTSAALTLSGGATCTITCAPIRQEGHIP